MGRPAGNGRKYEIQNLWDVHHEIIRLIVLGYRNTEIAAIVGCSPQTVSLTRNSAICKERIRTLRMERDENTVDVLKTLEGEAPKALELLQKVRSGELSDDIKLRVSVAQDLLSRAGYAKVQKVKGTMMHGLVTEEVIERIKAHRNAVDADYIDVEETPEDGVAEEAGLIAK